MDQNKVVNKRAKQSATDKQVQINIEPEAKIINIPYGTQEETQLTLRRISQVKVTRQGVQGEQRLTTQTRTRGSGTGEESGEGRGQVREGKHRGKQHGGHTEKTEETQKGHEFKTQDRTRRQRISNHES